MAEIEFPEYLATKFDYDYVREHFPIRKWLPVYEELVRDYKKWQKVKELKVKTEGKEDKDNKVIEEKDDKTKEIKYLQYSYKIDENCKIKRLGMDIAEIENIIAKAIEEQKAEFK
jgi:hypothetical protein